MWSEYEIQSNSDANRKVGGSRISRYVAKEARAGSFAKQTTHQ